MKKRTKLMIIASAALLVLVGIYLAIPKNIFYYQTDVETLQGGLDESNAIMQKINSAAEFQSYEIELAGRDLCKENKEYIYHYYYGSDADAFYDIQLHLSDKKIAVSDYVFLKFSAGVKQPIQNVDADMLFRMQICYSAYYLSKPTASCWLIYPCITPTPRCPSARMNTTSAVSISTR